MKKIAIVMIMLLGFSLLAKEITLKEAIEIGLKNNPDINISSADYKASVWQKAGAISTVLPSVSLFGATSHSEESDMPPSATFMSPKSDTGNFGIRVSQPLFMGGKIVTAYKIASETKKMKKFMLQSKIEDIKAEITSKYFEAVKQKLMVSIAEEQLKNAKKNLAIALQKYQAGLLSKANFLQIQLNKKNIEINLMSQKAALKLALDKLNQVIGGSDYYQVSQKQKINYKSFKSAVDTLSLLDDVPNFIIERCKKQNTNLQIFKKSQKLSLLSHRLSYAEFLPTLSFSYNKTWQSSWNTWDEFKNADYNESSSYGFNFSMPIFPIFNNYSNYKKSLWNLKKSKIETRKNTKNIITLLKSTYWQFLTLFKQIESSKIALDYAEEMYKISQEKFKNSLISANDLLTTQISYQNAQFNYVQTIYNFINTKNRLKTVLNFKEDDELISFLNMEEK